MVIIGKSLHFKSIGLFLKGNLLICSFIFPALLLPAQEPPYWQLTDEHGLPSMTIYQILQDKQGYIWLGTQGGLCRYNGREVKRYNSPELIDNEIVFLYNDAWGRIWLGNISGQVAYINDTEIVVVKQGAEAESDRAGTLMGC